MLAIVHLLWFKVHHIIIVIIVPMITKKVMKMTMTITITIIVVPVVIVAAVTIVLTGGSHLAPPGLIAYNLGGIEPSDIEFVAAFDVVESKVGRDLADAIFASPNNTIKICDVNKTGITVEKGEVLDGVGKHLNERVKISDKSPPNIAQILKDSGARDPHKLSSCGKQTGHKVLCRTMS